MMESSRGLETYTLCGTRVADTLQYWVSSEVERKARTIDNINVVN